MYSVASLTFNYIVYRSIIKNGKYRGHREGETESEYC